MYTQGTLISSTGIRVQDEITLTRILKKNIDVLKNLSAAPCKMELAVFPSIISKQKENIISKVIANNIKTHLRSFLHVRLPEYRFLSIVFQNVHIVSCVY